MRKILISFLTTASFAVVAETVPSAEQLFTSGDPVQVAIGYQHCGTAMLLLGNAASPSSPQEGAGYIAIGQRYGRLYRNASDLRTEEKRSESQAQITKVMHTYAEMIGSDTRRKFFLNDVAFCQKWIKEN